MNVHARFCNTKGEGVGRWRLMYAGAEDLREAIWAARDIIDSAQVRVLEGRKVVVAPVRAATFKRLTPSQVSADMDRYGHVAGWR